MSAIPHLQSHVAIVIKNDFVGSLTEKFLPSKQADFIYGLGLIVFQRMYLQ